MPKVISCSDGWYHWEKIHSVQWCLENYLWLDSEMCQSSEQKKMCGVMCQSQYAVFAVMIWTSSSWEIQWINPEVMCSGVRIYEMERFLESWLSGALKCVLSEVIMWTWCWMLSDVWNILGIFPQTLCSCTRSSTQYLKSQDESAFFLKKKKLKITVNEWRNICPWHQSSQNGVILEIMWK